MNLSIQLFEQLAHITSLRDIQRLELSLLKTLHETLPIDNALMIKLEQDSTIRCLVRLSDNTQELLTLAPEDAPDWLDLSWASGKSDSAPQSFELPDSKKTYLSLFPLVDLKTHNLCLAFTSARQLTPPEQLLVKGFLQIYRNFCALVTDAQQDQLTGLLNRKTFDEAILHLIQNSDQPPVHQERRSKKRLISTQDRRQVANKVNSWIAVLDIDNFKRINDRFGHLYGDEVLILLARIMREAFRQEDLLYRFGGEEFVVVTQPAQKEGAIQAFERLREKIATYPFPQVGEVTISIGLTRIRPDYPVPTLLDRADQALYFAKRNGKNKVCVYEQLIEQGALNPVTIETGEVELF